MRLTGRGKREGGRVGPLLALAALAGCGPPAPGNAASDVGRFSFQAERVPVGTAFHYVKSNIDGTQAIRVVVYVAATDRIEVVKLEPENRAGVRVTAHLDWATFSADTLTSEHLSPDGPPRPQARAWITPDARFVVEIGDRTDTVAVPRFPAHVYNFDFLSLAQTFAHLRDPEGTFTVGVFNPTFGEGPHLLSFDGAATVRFEGEVPCHAAVCRRYAVSGPGLRGVTGTITVHRDLGHVQSMEIPLPDNPGWRDFKLELQRTDAMGRAAWDRWVAAEVAKL